MRVERGILVAGLALVIGVGHVAGVGPVSQQLRIAQNEAAVLADIRDILAAAQLYKASNGTWPSTLVCLGAPSYDCPGGAVGPFPPGTPPFLDPLRGAVPGVPGVLNQNEFVSHGYHFVYVAGIFSSSGQFDYGVNAFTLNADPVIPGNSGQRYFETDYTGLICGQTTSPFSNNGLALDPGCAIL